MYFKLFSFLGQVRVFLFSLSLPVGRKRRGKLQQNSKSRNKPDGQYVSGKSLIFGGNSEGRGALVSAALSRTLNSTNPLSFPAFPCRTPVATIYYSQLRPMAEFYSSALLSYKKYLIGVFNNY